MAVWQGVNSRQDYCQIFAGLAGVLLWRCDLWSYRVVRHAVCVVWAVINIFWILILERRRFFQLNWWVYLKFRMKKLVLKVFLLCYNELLRVKFKGELLKDFLEHQRGFLVDFSWTSWLYQFLIVSLNPIGFWFRNHKNSKNRPRHTKFLVNCFITC